MNLSTNEILASKLGKLHWAVVLLLLLFTIVSCEKMAEAYVGLPLQPKLEDNNYVPGLNILGVLRPDFTDSISNSFVHVQEVAPAVDNYPEFTMDSMIVKQASVVIESDSGESFNFTYTSHNGLFVDDQYRPEYEFKPTAGETYSIICNYMQLPELKAETTIPDMPQIIESTLVYSGSSISFALNADTTSYMYEVYVFNSEASIAYARIIPERGSNTFIDLTLTGNNAKVLVVYGYDYNLATYYASSNTSFNFNKYRKPFGDIEGGYGVFGSVNYAVAELN